MDQNKRIKIEVAYATPTAQRIITIEMVADATLEMAIQQSGILSIFPEIDLTQQKIGIFGKQRALTDKINAGDRIEIYRPLTIDPKEARRARAVKKKAD